MSDGALYKVRMAETNEDDAVVNVKVPRALRRELDRACVMRPPPAVGRYTLADVVRIVLARATAAKMHERLELFEAGDAGEEGAS